MTATSLSLGVCQSLGGGRYGNGCTGRRVANAGYVRAACSILVQKPVHQHMSCSNIRFP